MIKRIRESLILKWMVFSILLATIPLSIAGFSIIQIYQKNLKKSVIEIEGMKANIIVERTEAFFEKVTSNLLFLARDENFRKAGPSHAKGHLENLLYQNDYLVELTLLNEKGQETIKISKYNVFGPSDLKSQSKSQMFGTASKGKIYYGEFHLTTDIVPSMVISVPIEEYKGEPVGVLSVKIHLRYLWNLLPQTQIGKRGTTYVVDKEGSLIAHPDTRRVLLRINMRHLPMVDKAITGKEGNLEFEYPKGEKFLGVYKPIKELGWGVIVQVPVEEAYAPLRQVANTALKWILIALSIAIIFSLFLTRKLTHPIKQLFHQMGKVSQGNLDVQIAPTTKDELGLLTESFNQMIRDLKQSHEALKEAEAKYRMIFENSKDMVFITTVDGRFMEVNQAGVEMLGYESKEELMATPVRDLYLSPEDRKRYQNEIAKEAFIKDFEVKLKRKDGTPIDVLITSTTRKDEEGRIIGYEGIIKDISARKKMEEDLLQRTGELQALHDLSVLINQTLDLEKVLPIALEKVMSLTGFEMGSIFMVNEERNILERKFHKGFPPEMLEDGEVLKYGEGVSGRAVILKQPIINSINEYSSFRVSPVLIEGGIQTLVGFPLLAKGKAIGTITLFSRSPRDLTQREVNLLESIGNQIGLALENALLFEETKKRLDELTILYDITKISTSSLNLDLMLREIINSLNSFFKFEALGILLIEENTKILVPHRASYNDLSISDIGKLGLCVGKGITGWVAEKGEPLLVDDVREDDRYICGDENIRSEMCVPLKVGQKVIGVIDAQSKELNAFSENDLRLLNIAGGQLATIIENIRLQEEIKQSEEKYRTVVEGALDGVLVVGDGYQIKYVNERLAEIVGYPREELIGMDFRNYLDDESRQLVIDRYVRRQKGEEVPPRYEFNVVQKNREIRNVEISSTIVKDSQGNVNTIAFLKDITDRKQAEEALQRSEETATRLAQENAIMAEIGRIISSTLNIEEVYERFAEEARKLIPFDRIAISLTDLKNNTSTTAYLAGIGVPGRGPADIIPMAGTVAEEVTHTRSSLLIQGDNINEVASRFPALLPTFQAGLRSMIFVPLMSKDQVIGVLSLRSLVPNAYTELDLRLAERVGNQIAGAIANAQLFTERKQAEEALRQSEEKYRTILENIEDGYYEVDIAGNFTFFNDSMCQIFGYPKEELMGMNDRQYTDETTAKKLYQAFNGVYRTGEPGRGFAYEIIRKDGTKRYIEASISLQKDSSGKPIGFRGVIRDITERKQAEEALRQSEEKYRAILENIEDGYYEVDLAGNMTFFNDSINRISGYSKEEAMGMNIRKYTDEETAKKVIQAYNRVYRTGEPYRGYSYEIIAKDGTKRYIEVSVSLQKDSSGKPIGFRGILRDITEKKRMEEQLLQSEKLRAVGEMASGVAHDFNNALAAILGNTQLLLYTTKDEELKGSLKVIEKVAWDSAQTVRRLQDFTRKSVHQELFKVDVNSIIKDSIEITKPKWKDEVQSRGIHIEMVSNFEEIPTVIGSTSELREVITNMIFNAIEAMPEGGKIEIRTFQRKSNVFIQISDSGIGMTEEVKKKAFEPFFTTKPFSNTGLGLSMSYGVIKRFGGEIEVESKVGHGATFTIILPIGLEGKEEVDVSPIIKKGREARILVIDDEETVRSVLSRILSQVNHQVTVAENGEEGIRLFREKDFDLVLTDLGMPGMSGWEVCRAIKKMSSHIPVGMITGWGIEVDQAKIEENGIDFVIPKPFQFDQILKVVDETIASRGSHL